MIQISYVLSILLSLYILFVDKDVSCILLILAIVLFLLPLSVQIFSFFKERKKVKRASSVQIVSEPIRYEPQEMDYFRILDFPISDYSSARRVNNFLAQKQIEMRQKAKGDDYEIQIANLIKRACVIFDFGYTLDVNSLVIEQRGITDKYGGKIDIAFSVKTKMGLVKDGVIQCKNWDCDYEIEARDIRAFSLESKYANMNNWVNAFYIVNKPDTIASINKRDFSNIDFLVIPSRDRIAREREVAIDELAVQVNRIKKIKNRNFGMDFSLAMFYACLQEIQEGEY